MRHECDTCYHAVFPRHRDVVECHRRAPQPENTHGEIDWCDTESWPIARWPIVEPTDVCGEWMGREGWQVDPR
jgi:hypothetical protein